jgi:hypothetical protein
MSKKWTTGRVKTTEILDGARSIRNGGVAERLKAPVLKTGSG